MTIDPRLMERRKTVAEDKAKRNVSRLLKFLAFALVIGGAVWFVFSPWLSVSQVVTTGIRTSDTNSVLADMGVTAGTPMIRIRTGAIERVLLEDPWIAEADVDLDWPDQVTVAIVERSPTAWVKTTDGWTRRARDGVALPSPSEPNPKMAWIEFPGVDDEETTVSVDLLGALEFVEALPADLRGGTVVTMNDDELWAKVAGFQVRLGRADDMAEKALSLAALISTNPLEGSTLVLIAPTNPAVMTPSSSGDQTGADDTGIDDETEGTDGEANEEGSTDDS